MRTIYQSINPINNTLLQAIQPISSQELDTIIMDGHRAFLDWRRKSYQERGVYFEQLAVLLKERVEQYAQIIVEEMGKPYTQAIAEVEKCILVCNYYKKNAAQFLAARTIQDKTINSKVIYQPLGVILQVMPWNFPFWQVFRFAMPTLMAGNTTLLKHAPNVPRCAAAIEQLFLDAGFPKGVFTNCFITEAMVEDVLKHPDIHGVALTGSTKAGKAVGQLAGKYVKTCVLELGGTDPFIVLKDADLQKAAIAGIRSRLHNSGQTCISAKRFIVERSVADTFLKYLKEGLDAEVLGDPFDPSTTISALARTDLADLLENQVNDSIRLGANVLHEGGRVATSNYFKPLILGNLKPGMPAFDQELFGPVFSFFVVENQQEAIALANQSSLGLGASVWTENIDVATQIALALESGAVAINQILRSDPRVPFGGVKDSGIGRELGIEGIRAFTNLKSIAY